METSTETPTLTERVAEKVDSLPFFLASFTAMVIATQQYYGQLPYHIAGFVGAAMRAADYYSTWRVFKKVQEAERSGLFIDVTEANPLLPERPTLKDLLHPARMTFEVALLLLATAEPALGFTYGLRSIAATANNYTVGERIETFIKRNEAFIGENRV